MSEDEDNDENNSVLENELSINSIMSTFNDDEEENSRQASSINSEEFPTHNVLTKVIYYLLWYGYMKFKKKNFPER